MSRFIARIELHNSQSSEDYTLLHAEMEKDLAFSRYIDAGGSQYHLPRAEYFRIGGNDETSNSVLALAYAAFLRLRDAVVKTSPTLEGRFMVIEVAANRIDDGAIVILNLEEKPKQTT